MPHAGIPTPFFRNVGAELSFKSAQSAEAAATFQATQQRAFEARNLGIERSRQDKIIADFKAAQDKANLANEERFKRGIGIFDDLVSRSQPGVAISETEQLARDLLRQNISTFEPGGTFGTEARSEFDVGATQSRAAAFQNLVSSGAANLTSSFDRQASFDRGRFNLNLQERRAGLETGARGVLSRSLSTVEANRRLALERSLTGKVGFIERREDVAPDPNLLANLIRQGASV